MSDYADIVREWFASDSRADTDSGSWDDWNAALAALDALVADLRATEQLATDERERRIAAEDELAKLRAEVSQ